LGKGTKNLRKPFLFAGVNMRLPGVSRVAHPAAAAGWRAFARLPMHCLALFAPYSVLFVDKIQKNVGSYLEKRKLLHTFVSDLRIQQRTLSK